MKKYTKPTVEVVNMKSSNDIAASFEHYKNTFIQQYLRKGSDGSDESLGNYSVSVYSNFNSLTEQDS